MQLQQMPRVSSGGTRRPRELQSSQLPRGSWEDDGPATPGNQAHKDKKVIGRNHYGFTKGSSCLMNPITSCDEMPGLVDEEQAVDIVCLVFKKAFNTVSRKLMGRQ